ncbi:MAG: ribonuclease Y, partial [Candidatus Omnitrophica bacterium]|nr:ribonuclease Y [Candidatus Omnitrophota bacterium]
MLDEKNIYIQSVVSWLVFSGVFFAGYLIRWFFAGKKLKASESQAKALTDSAQKEADHRRKEVELQGKDLMIKLRQDFERETKDRREEVINSEKRLQQKEENLDKRLDLLERKEKDINNRLEDLKNNEATVQGKRSDLDKLIEEEKQRLQKISSMNEDEAKNLLLSRVDEDLLQEKALRIRQMEDEIKDTVDKKARTIIGTAIQRCSSEHTAASTVTVVMLPSDEMKGRIIGREGRNIRALEAAAGVDIIIDDTPEAVTISGFDMFRREIAKIALENLIADGRIHPGRIEEVVEKAKKEMDTIIKEEGEKAAFDLGIHGMHAELLKLVGRLKFRTSYGQNVLQHSKEVAYLMGVMASELGADFNLARRIGLLHDIGKAVDHEVEGSHDKIGANLAKKYGESHQVIHAIEAHHESAEPKTLFAVLTQAADAVSASRPGARRETLES